VRRDIVTKLSLRSLALVAAFSGAFGAAGAILVVRHLVGDAALGSLSAVLPAEPVAIADPTVASDEQNNIEVYRAISPGVVNVTSTTLIETFFGVTPQEGSGSGSIIDSDGHVLTNYHVIETAARAGNQRSRVEVLLADKSSFPATIVGVDPDHDIAVLKINAPQSRLTVVPRGTSASLQVGQKVLAIGNPFNLEQTLTTGIISALERPLQAPSGQFIAGVIQTDASINPGNSGGPLLNSRGQMIGMNTAILSGSGGSVGIGFAVPVDTINRIVAELIQYGRVAKADLGADLRPLDRRVAGILEIDPDTKGLVVLRVASGGPASRAGIRGVRRLEFRYEVGDVVTSLDGREVSTLQDASLVLNSKRPGETIRVGLLRAGRPMMVSVVLGEASRARRVA
jgi:putative serine protease PepD